MRLIYPYRFSTNSNSGGQIHVNQFIKNIESMGHEIVTLNGDNERNDPGLGNGIWNKINKVRRSDVIYYRIEEKAPDDRMHNDIFRKFIQKPIIVWEFNTVPEYAQLLGTEAGEIEQEQKRFRRLAKYCDLAICVSKELARYVGNEFSIDNVCYVPNGSDPECFRNDLEPVKIIKSSPDILNVVWIGNAGIGWHDFDLMRSAAESLCHQGYESNILFHVIGGNMPSMADMPVNIKYYGTERYEDLPRWLAAMDVGLVLYREGPAYYNSPLKLFDYMASALAVVGTMQPQIKDISSEIGSTELIIPAGDHHQLAEKLVWLLGNKDKLKTYGDNARRVLVEKYTWKHNAERIIHEINKTQCSHQY